MSPIRLIGILKKKKKKKNSSPFRLLFSRILLCGIFLIQLFPGDCWTPNQLQTILPITPNMTSVTQHPSKIIPPVLSYYPHLPLYVQGPAINFRLVPEQTPSGCWLNVIFTYNNEEFGDPYGDHPTPLRHHAPCPPPPPPSPHRSLVFLY